MGLANPLMTSRRFSLILLHVLTHWNAKTEEEKSNKDYIWNGAQKISGAGFRVLFLLLLHSDFSVRILWLNVQSPFSLIGRLLQTQLLQYSTTD
jgi:hypothetical protein